MKCILNNLFLLSLLLMALISCKTEIKNTETTEKTSIPVKKALLKHTVLSDGHPMAVWEKKADNPKGLILFVHGRTWSGVPDFDLQVEGENLERLMRQKVDGIFISLTKNTTSTDYLTKVMSSSSSLITFSNTSKVISCNKVVFNDRAIIKLVTEYLINKGNSKIAFIRKSLISQNSINQFIGFREAHEVNKISIDNQRIVVSKQGTLSEGYRIAKELFNSGIQIDGFISYNDPLAHGAMMFYKENGSNIPNDICFIGQENSEIGTFFSPELSSIKQNLSLMAEKIMRLFLEEQAELKQKKISSFKREEIEAELIERASSI